MNADDAKRILDNARIHVPGALDSVLLLELYNVVREFLDFSDVWKEDILIRTVPDRTEYDFAASAEVARLVSLVDANKIPVAATMAEPTIIVLNTAPSQAQTLTATVSLKSDDVDADGTPAMPDWISHKYHDYLMNGLVAQLMAQPVKPYSNAVLAAYHRKQFRNGVAMARQQAQQMNLYGGQAWRFPSMALSRRK